MHTDWPGTAALDRNLAYLGLVEVLYGYPLDGVVLTIGCDKTTLPADNSEPETRFLRATHMLAAIPSVRRF